MQQGSASSKGRAARHAAACLRRPAPCYTCTPRPPAHGATPSTPPACSRQQCSRQMQMQHRVRPAVQPPRQSYLVSWQLVLLFQHALQRPVVESLDVAQAPLPREELPGIPASGGHRARHAIQQLNHLGGGGQGWRGGEREGARLKARGEAGGEKGAQGVLLSASLSVICPRCRRAPLPVFPATASLNRATFARRPRATTIPTNNPSSRTPRRQPALQHLHHPPAPCDPHPGCSPCPPWAQTGSRL